MHRPFAGRAASRPAKACALLGGLNERLEAGGGLPEDVWVRWLWQTAPEEPVAPTVLLNESHLLGLLVCRHQAMQAAGRGVQTRRQRPPECADQRIQVVDRAPAEMSLRELRDTLDNLLIEWPRFLQRLDDNPRAEENLRAVVGLVDGCLARFGHLALHPGKPDVFDDGASTEPHDGGEGLVRLSRPCLRRTLGSFMILYRHLHLMGRAEAVEPVPFDCGVSKHHMEASGDEFTLLCMNMQLPVAARLNYKHDFPGMYNHVSQVVYFHNAQYERTRRAPLAQALEGDPVHVLPALRQLHPEVAIHYEEDPVDLSQGTGKWLWLVVPGRVYLVDPQGRAYHSPNVTSLLRVYLERRAA